MRTVLVVGGESLIGQALSRELRQDAVPFVTTTRRTGANRENSRVLDLADPGSFDGLGFFSEAYICAAVTRIEECERNPALTWRLNVANTVSLIGSLVKSGSFVVYLSSNAVFDGQKELPGETTDVNPTNEYGRQKAAVEKEMLAMKPQALAGAAVVRITKVISAAIPLFKGWLDAIASGKPCSAFSNVALSPVSLKYAVGLLLEIGRRGMSGVYHCSGATDISYFEFVKRLCSAAGKPIDIVKPAETPADTVIFRPVHGSLSMNMTQRSLGTGPQPLDSAISDMWREYRTLGRL